MRKQTKVAVVVSAAALLAMGASMTSFAKGWTLEDNEWVWLDSEGERVYGEWKKSVDGNYYWLDEETGVMATDRLVEDEDDTYYVNSDGIRITNNWKAVENEDGESVNGVEVDELWYYFGSNGKAYKATKEDLVKKTIGNHTYFFDTNGYMQHGWIPYVKDGKTTYYYCGTEDQGYAYKGWQYLETADVEHLTQGEYEDEEWFYFDGGKMVKSDNADLKTKYIDGHYFGFNNEGVMETGWNNVNIASGAELNIGTDAETYIADNGVMSSGWVKADKNDESKWFYMVTVRSGKNSYRAVPFNSGSEYYRAKSIDGKVFAFDTEGRMLTGLQKFGAEYGDKILAPANNDYDGVTSKDLENGIYYFEKEGNNKGAMKTGKVTHTDEGEEYNYYFASNGKAITNAFKDNVIYGADGVRIEAEDGNSYEIVEIEQDIYRVDNKGKKTALEIAKGSKVVVSSTGKIRTSKTITIDGEKYTIDYNKGGVSNVTLKVED